MTKWNLLQVYKLIQHSKFYQHIQNISRLKRKQKHMIIPTDTEKKLGIISYPFMAKTLRKRELEGNFLNLIKSNYKTPKLTSYFIVKD